MVKKRILVTGGLGHIGSKLIREYAKRKDVELIRILDNLSTQRYPSLFDLLCGEDIPRYEFIEGDVRDREDCERACDGIDVVLHLAALTDAPRTVEKARETFDINLAGTLKMVASAINSGVKKFLLASTTSVYGGTEGVVNETSELNMEEVNKVPYTATRVLAEQSLLYAAKAKLIDGEILRMGTIFGYSPGMRFHTAVNRFTWQAITNQPLTIWADAIDQQRPYLALDDAIRAWRFLEKRGESGEVYNVVTGNYTVRQVVETIQKHLYLRTQDVSNPSPSQIINQRSYSASAEKIKNLGFEFKGNLEKSIAETIRHFDGIIPEGIKKYT